MTEKELLEIEEFFIEKGEKTIVKLGGVGFVIVGTLIYLPFFRQSIFSAILVGIYFFCYIIALGVKFYYRFKYSEAYKMRSEIERKDWHYLYTKKHWRIRSINVKFGYSICIQLVGVLALFLGLKEVPVSILYAVLIPLRVFLKST
jgi:hypothetical protein